LSEKRHDEKRNTTVKEHSASWFVAHVWNNSNNYNYQCYKYNYLAESTVFTGAQRK